jgi:hypothetical protein
MWQLNHEEKNLVLTNKKLLYIFGKIERYDALFTFYKKIIIPKSVLTELEFFAEKEYPNFIKQLAKFKDQHIVTLVNATPKYPIFDTRKCHLALKFLISEKECISAVQNKISNRKGGEL